MRAITNVNGLYLSKRNYTHLTANYPAFKKYLETVANLREKARQEQKKPRSLGKKQPVKKPETLPDTMAIRMQAAWKAQRTRKEIAEMRQGQGGAQCQPSHQAQVGHVHPEGAGHPWSPTGALS